MYNEWFVCFLDIYTLKFSFMVKWIGFVSACVIEVFVMFYMLGYCMSNNKLAFVVMWYLFFDQNSLSSRKRVFKMEDSYLVETV